MRRILLLLVPLLALVLAVPADAAPPRSFATDYLGTGLAGVGGQHIGARCGVQCVSFTVAKGERQVRVSVSDSSGRPVGWVASIGNGIAVRGCGTAVVPATPGQTWWVQTAVLDTCAGAPTRGRLVADVLR